MIAEERVDDLLSIYLAAGRSRTPEEVCRDCPELLGELRSRIAAAEGMNELVRDTTGALETPAPDDGGAAPGTVGMPAAHRFGRYEVIEELGRGGMGVVHKVRDTRAGRVVALKTMRLHGGRALELFKGEFRYLQGVSHPNLVQLYELEADKGELLLTMEFIEGESFSDLLRPRPEGPGTGGTPPAVPPQDATDDYHPLQSVSDAGSAGVAAKPGPTDLNRVRDGFGQLAEGLAALHAHRRVHRDLKPMNVRVGRDGRVVVLDFGLTAALDHADEYRASALMGTAAYMAPEQGGDPPVATPASDWYAFGVMLYEALAGVLPFRGGRILELIARKRTQVPPRPRDLCPTVPEELDDLCMALLRGDPGDRPTGEEVLRVLGRDAARTSEGSPRSSGAPLLGRDRYLAELRDAYSSCGRAGAVVVGVKGPSGIGKSALLEHFLDRLRAEGAVVLSGRCYEHESVPYKALDPLVDELARYLHGLPDERVENLLPAETGALVRVFPVLERVAAVGRSAGRGRVPPDPLELRRRAFVGLRELLGQLAGTVRLVLHIDDLQWGDVDSAYLIADLIQPPDPPRALWLLAHRSEDAASPCLRTLTDALRRGGAVDIRDMTVAPLTEEETRALVAASLGAGHDGRAAEIARESGGNPFFITELIRWTGAEPGARHVGPGGAHQTLDGMIRSRVSQLPDGARHLLELVAVSGRPLRDLDAYRAAGGGADARTLMARLEAGRFLRGIGPADDLRLETYHDRVREAVVGGLGGGAARGHHGRLAAALEESGRGEPEELAQHFEGAGAGEKAGGYYARAGDRAAGAVAFDQAAESYRKALELLRPAAGDGRELRTKWADALANAGRGAEAGPAYLTAAEGAAGLSKIELHKHAMEQFLVSGQTERGLEVAAELFARFGQRLPRGPRRALVAMLWEMIRLRVRGIRFRERPAAEVPAKELLRIDVLHTAAHQLTMLDGATMSCFMHRAARWALAAGEPHRIARCLSGVAAMTALEGGAARARATRMIDTALELSRRPGDPFGRPYVTHNVALLSWSFGEWETLLRHLVRTHELVAEEHVSFATYQTNLQHFALDGLLLSGRWGQFAADVVGYLEAARRRGDRYATSAMLVHSYLPALMAARPDEAEARARESWEAWPQKGNVMGVYWGLYARVEATLYRGDGPGALQLLHHEQGELNSNTHFKLFQTLHLLMVHLQGRAGLASAAAAPRAGRYFGERPKLLRSAARQARRIEKANMPWSNPLAGLLRAGHANLHARPDKAISILAAAETALDTAGMRMYAAAARRQRGRLIGGDAGRDLIRSADAFMTGEGVREPDRIAAVLAPGFPD